MSEKNNGRYSEYFGVYDEYARTLRSWFIALAVAIPGLLVLSNDVVTNLKKSEQLNWVVWPLFLAVAVQVALMVINKTVAWIQYAKHDPDMQGRVSDRLHKNAVKISGWIWLDVLVDVATSVMFLSSAAVLIKGM
jgi:hypothetical protein